MSINHRNNRPSGSGGQGHVEEGCNSSFGSQRGSISENVVYCEKERRRNFPISQPKGFEQQYSVLALQDGRVFAVEENVVNRGLNVLDRY